MYRERRQVDVASSSSPPPLAPLDTSDDPSSSPTPLPPLSLSLSQSQSPSSLARRSTSSSSSRLLSPTLSSNSDPFSGSAKASLQSHPSFSKEELRSKHLARHFGPLAAGASASASHLASRIDVDRRRDDALASHFVDSSDDAPYSSDDAAAATAARPLENQQHQHNHQPIPFVIGLGLGQDEDVSELPTLWNHLQQHQAQRAAAAASSSQGLAAGLGEAFQEPRAKARARTFSRTQSSNTDPFSAGAGSGSQQAAASTSSPRASSSRPKKKERPVGTSPKKLTRARHTVMRGGGVDDGGFESSEGDEAVPQPWEQLAPPRAVDWDEVVNHVFEKTDGRINLEGKALQRIDPLIGDLAKFVVLPPLSRTSSFARVPSSSTSPFPPPPPSSSQQPPSSQSPSQPSSSQQQQRRRDKTSALELYLYNNALRALPSALFDLGANLRVLSVRQNNLTELPAAIGELSALRELNISSNKLRWLPAEMQRLALDELLFFPNPFAQPPPGARLTVRLPLGAAAAASSSPTSNFWSRGGRTTSFALIQTQAATATSQRGIARHLAAHADPPRLPSLVEVCLRRLLEPLPTGGGVGGGGGDDEGEMNGHGDGHATDDARPLLEAYEAGSLLSLKTGGLHPDLLLRLEAARRSATGTWSRRAVTGAANAAATGAHSSSAAGRAARRKRASWISRSVVSSANANASKSTDGGWSSSSSSSSPSSPSSSSWAEADTEERGGVARDVEEQLDEGDDAVRNPWFSRCPCPRHVQGPARRRGAAAGAARTASTTATTAAMNGHDDDLRDWPRTQGPVFCSEGARRLEWVSHVGGFRVASPAVRTAFVGPQPPPPRQQPQQGQQQGQQQAQQQQAQQQQVQQQQQQQGQLVDGSGCLPLLWRGCGPTCLDFLLA
ncbi:hypothetical protein FA10DRAFT_97449 [Acaromyces ingoldii]|uniref:L domain-like protein n=1 Tax=Acaromyces ingoldii TaxID=215250 RepID=A0A316YL62_9BASI|nr:hypothetical protein FA10DRAFT_97449 [Acaromyces ingoldii]PWN89786.1 hypothetical protein FA10DRAFT_97449 [Acaromyces ingoldii]